MTVYEKSLVKLEIYYIQGHCTMNEVYGAYYVPVFRSVMLQNVFYSALIMTLPMLEVSCIERDILKVFENEFPPSECMLVTFSQSIFDVINEDYVVCHDGVGCIKQAFDTKLYCAVYLWYSGDITLLKSMPYQPMITKSIIINLLPEKDYFSMNLTSYFITEVRLTNHGLVIIRCTNGKIFQINEQQGTKIIELCKFPWDGMLWKFAYWGTQKLPPAHVEKSLFEIIAKKFKVRTKYIPGPFGYYEGSIEHKVLTGEVDFTGSYQVLNSTGGQWFTYPFGMISMHYFSRYPIVLQTKWSNILEVFDINSWLVIIITLGSFSIILALIYTCYSQILYTWDLIDTGHHPNGYCDFFLLPFFATNEPFSINWFSSFISSGYIMRGVWGILCLLFTLCFTCNLRAQLIKPAYEEPIETPEDMFARGQNIWIPHLVDDIKKPWEIIHYHRNLARSDIAEYVLNRNTTFHGENGLILPEKVMKDVLDNGASLMYYADIMSGFGYPSKLLIAQYGQLRRTKEEATSIQQHQAFIIRKSSPWREDFDYRIIQLRGLGLIEKFSRKVVKKYIQRPSVIRKISNADLEQLKLITFAFMIVFLLIGLFISFIAVSVEVCNPNNEFLASL